VRVLYRADDLFDGWRGVPAALKPAIGGALLGLVALAYPSLTGVRWERVPHVFNVGYDVIEQSLASELSLMILLTLFVLKMLATSLTLGSGGSGGVFAPSLFMGAMLGGAFALVAESLFPSVPAPAGAYALVGMAAMFAACAHAPITAIIILFELTGDYRIMLPLMLTTVVATLAARKMLGGESIYSLKLARRGGQLSRGRDAALLAGVSVSEIMAHDVASVPSDVPIGELGEHFRRRRKTGLLVHGQPGVLAGVVTLSDLEKALERGDPATAAAGSIATQLEDLEIVNPDDTMGTALARMAARGGRPTARRRARRQPANPRRRAPRRRHPRLSAGVGTPGRSERRLGRLGQGWTR